MADRGRHALPARAGRPTPVKQDPCGSLGRHALAPPGERVNLLTRARRGQGTEHPFQWAESWTFLALAFLAALAALLIRTGTIQ